jgi:hypothetical protein
VDERILNSESWKKAAQIKAFKGALARDRRFEEDQLYKPTRSGERLKIIVSGPVVERWNYEIPVKVGKRLREIDPETGEVLNGGKTMQVELDADGNIIKKQLAKSEAKRHNSRRSKMQLRRIVLSNFENMDKFVTLTFRDGAVSDVQNVKECNGAFDKFIKRLRRKYGDFRYCRVIEFQDTNGRGAVHYHCIMTLPYVRYEELGDTWGNGFIGINAIDHVDNVGAYIQKYMTKDFDDDRLAGAKAYATSQNLQRPIVLYGEEAEEINETFLAQKKEVFANEYVSEYQGNIQYTEYNTNRE